MRKVLGTLTTVVLAILLVSYALWTSKRHVGHYLTDLRIQLVVNDGQPSDRGNLLGIQPELFPTDYQSPNACTASSPRICNRLGIKGC
jgi:hypothetical protein